MKKTDKLITVGFCTGTFDLTHENHFVYLKAVKQRCDLLIVGLTSDELAIKQKREPYLKYQHRKAILENSKYVDLVVKHNGETKSEMWYKLKFDILFIGYEYFGANEYSTFENQHPDIPVVYIPNIYSLQTSTSLEGSLIENNFLNKLSIFSKGVDGNSAPLIEYNNSKRRVIIKQIPIGESEYRLKNSDLRTSDVYNIGFPLPRDWKKMPFVKKYTDISGLNKYREIDILNIVNFDWNPIFMYKEVFLTSKSNLEIKDFKSNIELLCYERHNFSSMHWLYMNYGGPTLKEWLKQNFKDETKFELFNQIIENVIRAILQMKQVGVVHGDIHSENILVDDLNDNKISIIDFGWCMHSSFSMTDVEKTYYEKCLNTNFDWNHFKDSIELDNVPKYELNKFDSYFE
jgi:glycerol-3-phosphate cytidylyltransferase